MPQPTLQQLFAASSRKSQEKHVSTTINSSAHCSSDSCEERAAAAVAAGSGSTGQHASVQQSKENQAVVHPAAGVIKTELRPQQHIQSDGALAAKATSFPDKASSKAKQQPRTTQLYLDLGQRDFGASRCSVCGMVYTKGHQEDEKLHKAYHQGAVQGFKFQGWPEERVLLSEVALGRLLMVLQTDPANHVKKVRELCAYVEKAHGMAPGWLLSAPQARVFMYVSSQRRVVGLAVVEPLKRAYRVMAPEGSQEQEVESCHTVQPPAQQQQQPETSSLLGAAPAMQQQQMQKRQSQDLLWPGLRKRGRLAALGRATGSVGNTPLSLTSPGTTSGATPSCNLKADSCPTSLLAAAGRMQVQAESSDQAAAAQAAGGEAAAAAAEAGVQQDSSKHAAADGEGFQQRSSLLSLSQPSGGQQLMEMQQEVQLQPAAQLPGQQQSQQPAVDEASQLMPPPPQQQQLRQQQQQHRSYAASIHGSSGPVNTAAAATGCGSKLGCSGAGGSGGAAGGSSSRGAARVGSSWGAAGAGGSGGAARAGSSGGAAGAGSSGGAARAGNSWGAAGAGDSGGTARGGGSGGRGRTGSIVAGGGSGGRSLLVDQHKAVRAMVGVRMVWVSPEQRRKGLATKLLDAARCNMVPAYVVPCRGVAFSQPSGDGVALAAAFAGTQQFLVYGLDCN